MRVINPDHRLIAHKLTYLRDKRTDSPTFRRLAEELMTLLAYEATRDVRVEPFEIETPVAPTTGIKLSNPKPLIVPILRAGLGMLEGMVRLLPSAEVGFLGMQRDEETLQAITYANRLPDDLSGRQVYVLDPMLATGGSMADAIKFLIERGADDITAVTLLSAPEGIAHLQEALAATRKPAACSQLTIRERTSVSVNISSSTLRSWPPTLTTAQGKMIFSTRLPFSVAPRLVGLRPFLKRVW